MKLKTLFVGLLWLISQTCFAQAGSALQFDGSSSYVQVADNSLLNPFPMTLTVWFRTTNGSNPSQGIVDKYVNSSGNGYFLVVQNGRLRGYYSIPGKLAIDAQSTTSVVDGFWHHAALTVDASGGKLYLDGVLIGTGVWSGGAAPAGAAPFLIGNLQPGGEFLQGQVDEVTLWNRSLGGAEVNNLKHRQLAGTEDGLVALWHFDDGAGSTAADATGNGLDGALINNPIWTNSTAPIVFNPVAGTAVKFSGANDSESITVPYDPALNSFPLTVMGWIRTSRVGATGDGIVTKYVDASRNGFAMFMVNGHMRGWYFRDASDYVWNGSEGLDGGLIADGQWHHVAFVVDQFSGRFYVDGVQTALVNWTGMAGAPSTTTPLKIGEYDTYPNSLQGVADEISIWNAALTSAQINAFKNTPLVGTESGLVALWHLNEGSGVTAGDATGNGHDGALVNNPSWTGSTASVGDGTSVTLTELGALTWGRQFAVNTIPSENSFLVSAPLWTRRLDDFGADSAGETVNVALQTTLNSALLAGPVTTDNSSSNFVATLAPFLAAAPQSSAGGVLQATSLQILPDPSVQLDSVNDSFQTVVSASQSLNGGAAQNAETFATTSVPLMQFDGHLFFGAVGTVFTALSGTPARGLPAAGGISTSLNVLTGHLAAKPDHQYGSGASLNVVLQSNGDAISSSSTTLVAPTPDIDSINGISFSRSNEKLTATGATAAVALVTPLGFSLGTSSTNHLTTNEVACGSVTLDANLDPINSAFTLPGPWLAIAETLPYWFASPSLTWNVAAGNLTLQPSDGSFVRQQADDVLTAQQPNLVDPNVANRISNDGYFRNALPNGAALVVTADAQGAALVTTQLGLNPPELRPHFPFTSNAPNYGIAVGPGLFSVTDGLVDSTSYLTLPGDAPLLYGRDCSYTGCSSAQAGPAELDFTPVSAQFGFTPDGGMLAFGSVPTDNLRWGYATGGEFAQQAQGINAGAWCMSGTFLRGDQSAVADAQLPEVLLLSGFGNDSDPGYLERPGDTNYPVGAANYAGLNFRSPGQGESYVAQYDTGTYSLDPVSKYYARFGGVSGIHQAALNAFPSSLPLYGYQFTFSDFGLSYLDGKNVESVTTGAVSFPPKPAGFTQPFDRMTLTCRGDLDSASVPAGQNAPDHLAYWNVDFTPDSIDFRPTNNDTCGTSPRFLVIGSEMKLPFIGQRLHAALGFQNDGNLITVADNVSNVTSRFTVPGTLSLQGPGSSAFALSTCAEGYFNNYTSPGAASLATGFFNLAGKLRTPFFEDIKVHLHVTPADATTAQVSVMGGWPDANSGGADLGWSVNNSNYFNMVNFDPNCDGWPRGIPITAYRKSSSTQYHPRAQRDWIEVAKFDYPLAWDDALHNLIGFQDATVKLPIIDVNSRLHELSPGKVDLDFAQDISVQLPRIKALDFLNDALNGNIGPLLSASNAIRQSIGQVLDVTGLNELQDALRDDSRNFFTPVLDSALAPVMNPIMTQIAQHPQTDVQTFLQQVYTDISDPNGALGQGISILNNATSQSNSVGLTLDKTLNDVVDTAGLIARILAKDPNTGQRTAITKIVEKLVADQGGPLNFATSLADSQVDPLLDDIDGTLTEIQIDAEDASNQVAQAKAELDGATGDFNQALSSVIGNGNDLQGFLQAAAHHVTNYLAGAITPAGDLLTANPALVQQTIRDQIVLAFLSSQFDANYQKVFRIFLSDDNVVLDEIMDSLFDQINNTIRNALVDEITDAKDGVFQHLKGGGLLGGTLFSAKIRGSPTFNGDSLRKIHLNSDVQVNVPDSMQFNAYMDISELDSQSTAIACVPPGGPSAEISLGARDVRLTWPGAGDESLTLSADAHWIQQNGAVLGLGGSLVIGGGPKFEGCQLKALGTTWAVGETENYFAAKADATVPILGIPVDLQAGFFAGQACTLDPLKFVDPEADQVLIDRPTQFRGVYVQYGGGLSLSDLLGFGDQGCLLNAGASVNTAYYFEGGAALGTIGGRQKMAVDISLLCLLSGHADWSQFLALDTSGKLTVGGSANVCGSVGPCPFCVSGCKGVTIKGVVSTSGVDYFIDY